MGPDAAGGDGRSQLNPRNLEPRVWPGGCGRHLHRAGANILSLLPSPQHRAGQTAPQPPRGDTGGVAGQGLRSLVLPPPLPMSPHRRSTTSGQLSQTSLLLVLAPGDFWGRVDKSLPPPSGPLRLPAGAFSPQGGAPGHSLSGPCPPTPAPSTSQEMKQEEGERVTDVCGRWAEYTQTCVVSCDQGHLCYTDTLPRPATRPCAPAGVSGSDPGTVTSLPTEISPVWFQ